MKNETVKPIYDWDSDSKPVKCPSCGETAMPLLGGKTYECYGCGDRWRTSSKKHLAALSKAKGTYED